MQSAQQKILTLIIIALLTISCTQKQQPEQTLPKQKPAVTKKEPIAPKPQIPTEQTTKSEMITIPSGKFIMGCKPSEKTCTKNEKHHGEIDNMAGNVKEWTNDYYDKHFYKRSAKTNPSVTKEAKYRSVRGGAFTNHMAASFMISKRSYFIPVNWDSSIGFRCAK